MVLGAPDAFASSAKDPYPRIVATRTSPKQFDAVAGGATLAIATPVARNDSTGLWGVWAGATNEVNTITANATPATAGDFTLSVDGETTAVIAFDATAADVQAALEALSNVDPGDVVAVQTAGTDLGDASAVVTLTWGGKYVGKNVLITADMSGLTGNLHVFATPTAGSGSDMNLIRGFVMEEFTLDDSGGDDEERLGVVMTAGQIHRDDVVLPAGETQGDLDAALVGGSPNLRELGIDVQGLAGVY